MLIVTIVGVAQGYGRPVGSWLSLTPNSMEFKFERPAVVMPVVSSGKTRSEVKKNVCFDLNYSHFAPSTYYRAFRTIYGFEEGSVNCRTPEQNKESQRRTFGALAALCGATNPGEVADAMMKGVE